MYDAMPFVEHVPTVRTFRLSGDERAATLVLGVAARRAAEDSLAFVRTGDRYETVLRETLVLVRTRDRYETVSRERDRYETVPRERARLGGAVGRENA